MGNGETSQKISMNIDKSEYERYKDYCKGTGRLLSHTMQLAMNEYIIRNPIRK